MWKKFASLGVILMVLIVARLVVHLLYREDEGKIINIEQTPLSKAESHLFYQDNRRKDQHDDAFHVAIFIHIGSIEPWRPYLRECVSNVGKARTMLSQSELGGPFKAHHSHNSAKQKQKKGNTFSLDVYMNFLESITTYQQEQVLRDIKQIPGVKSLYTSTKPNLGLDVKPFLDQIRGAAEAGRRYDIALKLHSKTLYDWRTHSLQCLCGTPAHVLSIISNFKQGPKIGLITPHGTTFGPKTMKERIHVIFEDMFSHSGPWISFGKDEVKTMRDLYKLLFGKPLRLPYNDLLIAAGSFYWFRFDSIHPLAWKVNDSMYTTGYVKDNRIEHALERLIPTIFINNDELVVDMTPAPKLLALYYPTYHPSPQMDLVYGPGATEWSMLQASKIAGLKTPLDSSKGGLGYYNLLDSKTRKKQALMAQWAGITGFIMYHYWFLGPTASDSHKVFHEVEEKVFVDGEPDIDFFFSWANSPIRSYAGHMSANSSTASHQSNYSSDYVFYSKEYGGEVEWRRHYEYLLPFFKLARYIKVNDMPCFAIHRTAHLGRAFYPMMQKWKEWAKASGFNGMHFIHTAGDKRSATSAVSESHKKTHIRPVTDLAVFHLFPHIMQTVPHKQMVSTSDIETFPFAQRQYWGICTGFNNAISRISPTKLTMSPNDMRDALTDMVHGVSVERWRWLRENFIVVNAWNGWIDQAVLEPDTTYSFQYLEAVRSALVNIPPRLIA